MGKHSKDVGLRIRQLRESYRYSREAFAEIVGISADFLYDIETGKKDFTTSNLKKICKAFNVSSDFLLFGDTNEQREIIYMINQLDEVKLRLAMDLIKVMVKDSSN